MWLPLARVSFASARLLLPLSCSRRKRNVDHAPRRSSMFRASLRLRYARGKKAIAIRNVARIETPLRLGCSGKQIRSRKGPEGSDVVENTTCSTFAKPSDKRIVRRSATALSPRTTPVRQMNFVWRAQSAEMKPDCRSPIAHLPQWRSSLYLGVGRPGWAQGQRPMFDIIVVAPRTMMPASGLPLLTSAASDSAIHDSSCGGLPKRSKQAV